MAFADFFSELMNGLLNLGWIEGTAVLFGVAYIILASRESIWCWPAAIISVVLYIYICYQAKLLAETALQIYYLIMGLYGWYNWNKGRRETDGDIKIISWNWRQHLLSILAGSIGTLGVGFFLLHQTDADLPFLDSFTTVFSLITTYMVARKVLENWLYWIIVDAAGAVMYFTKELYLTSVLFFAYVIIVIFGYFNWRKDYIKQQNAA